jgi:hypothetical protein
MMAGLNNLKVSLDDHIEFARLRVNYAEAVGEETVELPTEVARAILEAAKRSKKPKGRAPLTLDDQIRQHFIIGSAKAQKAALMADGVSAEDATERTAEWARRKFLPRMLSIETIKRMMKNR